MTTKTKPTARTYAQAKKELKEREAAIAALSYWDPKIVQGPELDTVHFHFRGVVFKVRGTASKLVISTEREPIGGYLATARYKGTDHATAVFVVGPGEPPFDD